MRWSGIAAAALLVSFAGVTAAGWAAERDAAYKNLVQLETGHRLIVSQKPDSEPQTVRSGTFGAIALEDTIYVITFAVVAGFVLGGFLRARSFSEGVKHGVS